MFSNDLNYISGILKRKYKSPRLGNKHNPLDELVYIVLSGATIERNFASAYLNLKRKYSKWENLIEASHKDIYNLIKHAGLGKKKAAIIKNIASDLSKRRRCVSLAYLRLFSDQEAISELMTFQGVGLKSSKCVLMYSLKRPVFPVDAHAKRILIRIGILNTGASIKQANSYLEEHIPNSIKYDLHVNLVAFGRDICRATQPRCIRCPLKRACHYCKGI